MTEAATETALENVTGLARIFIPNVDLTEEEIKQCGLATIRDLTLDMKKDRERKRDLVVYVQTYNVRLLEVLKTELDNKERDTPVFIDDLATLELGRRQEQQSAVNRNRPRRKRIRVDPSPKTTTEQVAARDRVRLIRETLTIVYNENYAVGTDYKLIPVTEDNNPHGKIVGVKLSRNAVEKAAETDRANKLIAPLVLKADIITKQLTAGTPPVSELEK